MARKVIVAVFAHPDDESFGPGGTLHKLAKENDVYIICVTNGDGKMGDRKKEVVLGKTRKKELLASSRMLGVRKVFFLGYRDGSLNNNMYHNLAGKIRPLLENLKPEQLITFEPRGISGHTDHIVVSNVTSFLFHRLDFVKSLWYYCISYEARALSGHNYFIHMPPGYTPEQIDKVVDVSDVWDKKVKAMYCHISQKHDADNILQRSKHLPKEEYFLIESKP